MNWPLSFALHVKFGSSVNKLAVSKINLLWFIGYNFQMISEFILLFALFKTAIPADAYVFDMHIFNYMGEN